MELDTIVQGDCLEVMGDMTNSSVNLIFADPPYFKFKKEWWDRQWDTTEGYLKWLDNVCHQWYRILKPNGSLYVCASPQMSAQVEVAIGKHFHVLNRIVWRKHDGSGYDTGSHSKQCKGSLRSFFPRSEFIVFAEHYRADNIARGETGYDTECSELHGFVFEPLQAYLDGERLRAEISQRQVTTHLSMTGHDPHFFKEIQWKLPLPDQYKAIQELFNQQGRQLVLPYEDFHDIPRSRFERKHSEYKYLRAEYDDLQIGRAHV